MSEIILSAQKIYKNYKAAYGEVPALKGVDADFEQGLFYAIIGRSGSGKSTLLHVLSGLDAPTSGKVILNGKDLYSYSDGEMALFRRRDMGFVFQQFNLLDEYNVLTNICMPLKLEGKKPEQSYLDGVVQTLGLAGKLKKYPYELSGGEQQRVAIARSVIAKPKLIFADEPTGNLDKKSSQTTLQLLKECAGRFGQTLIMVTHDPDVAAQADRMIRIEDGVIVAK
ncbi:MAG: ABC transporter ATP-binding protein [Lachnospiraceae bacterium]|nr:ABC transporter ATP-binding protein [Lachnospiraceae bacterium]